MADEGRIDERGRALLDRVDRDRLMEHTRAIARWERLSGSEEELEAFRYVEGVLKGYGYRTRLEHCTALISLPKSARLLIPGLGEVSCITHSMSTTVDRLQGEVVYCGAGRPEDYRRIDVAGRIALVEGIAMPGKVRAGEEAGAIAQIHISGDYLHEMCISTVWGSPSVETAALLPATPSVTISSSDGDAIKARLEQGALAAEITTVVDTGYRPIPLLTADLPGSVEPDSFVLFSGHIDSWYYGAMDNGSANATQLEVARLMAEAVPHRRGIRLAFWSGHSHGRYAGSTWYVDNHWEELHDHCVAHVNIDSVGGRGATVLGHSYAMQEFRPFIAGIIGELAGQEFHGARVGRAGDHSFMGAGVPAMLMDLSSQPVPEVETPTSRAFALLSGSQATGGLGWWWHTPHDTIDKVDPEFLERDARIYVALIHSLLNSPLLPMDLRLTVAEIADLLRSYREKARDHLDLAPLLSRVDALQEATQRLYRQAERIDASEDPDAARRVNRLLLRLSRVLTTLNYSELGRFEHDPAYGGAPLPLLKLIHRLPELTVGSDEYYQTLTTLVRRRNAVQYALREALEIAGTEVR